MWLFIWPKILWNEIKQENNEFIYSLAISMNNFIEHKIMNCKITEVDLHNFQSVIDKLNLARHNGDSNFTCGIPPHCGSYFQAIYASGEELKFLNNTSQIFNDSEAKELSDLFNNLAKNKN